MVSLKYGTTTLFFHKSIPFSKNQPECFTFQWNFKSGSRESYDHFKILVDETEGKTRAYGCNSR